MSILAVIVVALVAVLLLAMLLAAARKSAAVRAHAHLPAVDYDGQPFRSHAEASRRDDDVQT